ncbi:hypothetical protein [Streptomyces sp. NBC_01618]|uniref:hypothetical protein n=1 Tax=Streptomyces sp. NBC_01618 TaxID=2975900 RepID=UPI003863E477
MTGHRPLSALTAPLLAGGPLAVPQTAAAHGHPKPPPSYADVLDLHGTPAAAQPGDDEDKASLPPSCISTTEGRSRHAGQ